MPILAFTPVAVPDFFVHCTFCRFLKLSSPRNLNIALRFSRSYRIYTSYRIIQDHTGSIFPMYLLHYIIQDHTGNCFRCKITNCPCFTPPPPHKKRRKNIIVILGSETFNLFVKWISSSVYVSF